MLQLLLSLVMFDWWSISPRMCPPHVWFGDTRIEISWFLVAKICVVLFAGWLVLSLVCLFFSCQIVNEFSRVCCFFRCCSNPWHCAEHVKHDLTCELFGMPMLSTVHDMCHAMAIKVPWQWPPQRSSWVSGQHDGGPQGHGKGQGPGALRRSQRHSLHQRIYRPINLSINVFKFIYFCIFLESNCLFVWLSFWLSMKLYRTVYLFAYLSS